MQDKKRAELEGQLQQKVKEGGILNALKALGQIQAKEMHAALGMSPDKHSSNANANANMNPEQASILGIIEKYESKGMNDSLDIVQVSLSLSLSWKLEVEVEDEDL